MARKKSLPLIGDFDSIPEEALIPVGEEPYPIPRHWKWVRLGKVVRFQGGGTPNKNVSEYWNGDIPWASVKDLRGPVIASTQDYISEEGLRKSSAELCDPGDLLLATRIDPGRSAVADAAIAVNQDLKIVKSELVLSSYLRNWFASIPEWFEHHSSGSTVKGIAINKFNAMPFPLPPLDVQRQILLHLESRLANIDEVSVKLQGYLAHAVQRKAMLIQAAVSGRLTADWREENQMSKSLWSEVRFSSLGQIRPNIVDPQDYPDMPHIAPDSIEKGTGRLLEYRTVAEDRVKSGKNRFYAGQILYSKIRPYLSKVVAVDFDGLCSADMYPIDAVGDRDFLFYLMLSPEFVNKSSNVGSRTVLPKINQKELNALSFTIPPIEEQVIISGRLKVFLDSINLVDARIADVLSTLVATRSNLVSAALSGRFV